jgi:N-acetylglutamate synthase-like GNAT family acetyltransferase
VICEEGSFGQYNAPVVRPAQRVDLVRIRSWMAPHLRSGVLRARPLRPGDFLVSQHGCVALSEWAAGGMELGSLVSAQPGHGRALVAAALERARAQGAERVLCLTGAPGFFERMGFVRVADGRPPHQQAKPCAAVAWKAERCRLCPDAAACTHVWREVWL